MIPLCNYGVFIGAVRDAYEFTDHELKFAINRNSIGIGLTLGGYNEHFLRYREGLQNCRFAIRSEFFGQLESFPVI